MMFLAIWMMIGAMVAGNAGDGQQEEMLPLLKRHEVQVLLEAGFSMVDVARRAGVSVDTVERVRVEPPVAHVDDRAERVRRGIGRPSKAAPFTERVRGWIEQEPGVPTQELLRRALAAGYDGHKTAFYALVSGLRPVRAAPVVRFEGLPGEFSQHDFGQVDVRFVDGRKKRVHFFGSRLKFSRFVAVSLVPNEQTETLVRTLVRHFVSFGGVPLLAVFDRPRTIVTKSGIGREVESFNPTFAQVMLELGVGAEMCAPRSGEQKGNVEHLVKWVKNTFFKWRKFIDEADLESQLAEWVREVNHRIASRATGAIPETLRQQELPRLRPVRVLPENLALRMPIFVGPTAEITFEGLPYSMPPGAANVPGTAFVYEDRIRFVVGRHQAEHRRRRPGERPAPLPEHRAEKLAAVHGARARTYEMRQQLLGLGAAAMKLLTALVHRAPSRQSADVAALYALLEAHGDDAMRSALERVVERSSLTVHAVAEALGARAPKNVHPQPGRARETRPRGAKSSLPTQASPRTKAKRGLR